MRMRVPASSQAHFARVPSAEIERSVFDRSSRYKTTFDAGYLVPVFVDEALPGDTFNVHMTALARLATPLKPIMDDLWLDSFFFAVPLRLVWENFVKFMGEQTNPGDSTSFVIPTVTAPAGGWDIGSLHDYFGLPTGVAGIVCSALFHRAYYRIYNEWFRDENLINSQTPGLETGNGPDSSAQYSLKRSAKRPDYFTTCLPWPQKGTAVALPLTGNAPVVVGTQATAIGVGLAVAPGTPKLLNSVGVNNIQATASTGGTPMTADLSQVTAATINALRQAWQIQRLLERDARGGTRYTEIVKAHFRVESPDARLQRPEYLGGGTTAINVSPVVQTAPEQAAGVDTPQGNLAAVGMAALQGHGFVKSFTEHCIILGLVRVRAEQTYQYGIERMFSRSTRYDFFWPALAHIGEQAVLNKEIFAQGTGADASTFGYNERYAEYRYKPSKVTGKFRSADPTSLDVWHLAQEFASLPTLGETFIEENPPVARVIAVSTEPHLLFDAYFGQKTARPMPVYGVPGLVDHF